MSDAIKNELLSLRDALKYIKENTCSHVCLYGYNEAMSLQRVVDIAILVNNDGLGSNVKNFVSIVSTMPGYTKITDYHHDIKLHDRQLRLFLFGKGEGLFPERFESQLLLSKVVDRDLIWKPGADAEFWAGLYLKYVLDFSCDSHLKEVVRNKLSDRVGVFTNTKHIGLLQSVGKGR